MCCSHRTRHRSSGNVPLNMDLSTHQPDKMTSKVERLAAMVDDKTLISTLIRENSDRIKLIEFKDARADIWQHFRLVQLDETTLAYAVCTRCLKPVSYKAREGTGGLHRHPCSKAAAAAAASAGSTIASANTTNSTCSSHLLNLNANLSNSNESKMFANRSDGLLFATSTSLTTPPNHVIKGETFSDKDSFSSSDSPPLQCPPSPNQLSLVRSSTSTTRTPSPSVNQSPASSSSSPFSTAPSNSSSTALNSLFNHQTSLMSANLINSFVMNHLASQQAAALAASAFNQRTGPSNVPSRSQCASSESNLNTACSSSSSHSNRITSSSSSCKQHSPSNSCVPVNSAIDTDSHGVFAYANGSVRSDCHAMVLLADSKRPPFVPVPESFADLYERKILLDLTLICRDGQLRVHKLPLAAASPVLEDALTSSDVNLSTVDKSQHSLTKAGGSKGTLARASPSESDGSVKVSCRLCKSTLDSLNLTEYDLCTVNSVIEFIYYGDVNCPSDGSLCDILKFADTFQLNSLKFICAQRLYSQLSPENAIEYLGIAENSNCDELKSLIPLFIAENASKVTCSNSWKETFRDRSDLVANLLSVTASELTIIAAAANLASNGAQSSTFSPNKHDASSSPIHFSSSQLLHQLHSLVNQQQSDSSASNKKRKTAV